MNISFREKSLWLLLLSLIVVFGVYFVSVLPVRSSNVAPTHVGSFVGMLILLVVIQIIGQTLLAIANRRELASRIQSDERDALIKLKSMRLASYVLATGIFLSICVALVVPGNFAFVHVLLAFWVLAQAVEIVFQLIFYRQGAN